MSQHKNIKKHYIEVDFKELVETSPSSLTIYGQHVIHAVFLW